MRCPHCNKRIRSDAGNVICPHCGEFIMSQIKEREVDTVDHDKIEAERSEIRSEKKRAERDSGKPTARRSRGSAKYS